MARPDLAGWFECHYAGPQGFRDLFAADSVLNGIGDVNAQTSLRGAQLSGLITFLAQFLPDATVPSPWTAPQHRQLAARRTIEVTGERPSFQECRESDPRYDYITSASSS